jgi:hypothetical protein
MSNNATVATTSTCHNHHQLCRRTTVAPHHQLHTQRRRNSRRGSRVGCAMVAKGRFDSQWQDHQHHRSTQWQREGLETQTCLEPQVSFFYFIFHSTNICLQMDGPCYELQMNNADTLHLHGWTGEGGARVSTSLELQVWFFFIFTILMSILTIKYTYE